MSRYDDPDSPDYNDTNVGFGTCYDTPEEKQIMKLERELSACQAELAEAKEAAEQRLADYSKLVDRIVVQRERAERLEVENAALRADAERWRKYRIMPQADQAACCSTSALITDKCVDDYDAAKEQT